ncbi:MULTISPECIES: hypothetical protein [unclassified Winogradskyella]|uniref:hypothetical protein n=1 Tax=unclassified Winogradskyella TaxID=2615021 RepID=UPI001E50BF37|nr:MULTISPECIES: hypothetical protein [unclassified Winogradskyella]
MKKIFTLLLSITVLSSIAQNMTNKKLSELIYEITENVKGESGRWQFKIQEKVFIVLTDSTNNRMRIISPIADTISLEKNMLENALIANFHSALDVKYAISDGIIWSTFIHPLKELSEDQVKDAISQVYYANQNFGTTYASTSLIFPGRKQVEEKPKENKLKTRKT